VVLAVLVAVVSATVSAALALAHRTATAFTRQATSVHAADVWLDPGDRQMADLVASPAPSLAGLPGVTAEVRLGGVFVFFPDVAGMDPASVIHGDGFGFVSVAALDDPSRSGGERPVVARGRQPDWDRADEILVSQNVAAHAGWKVGQRVLMQYADATFLATNPTAGDLDAAMARLPKMTVTVTGFGRFASGPRQGLDALVMTTPAFVTARKPVAQYTINAVDLAPGTTSADVIASADASGRGQFRVDHELATIAKGYRDSVRPDVVSMVVFALALSVIATLVLGNALSRELFATAGDTSIRRALGMTRGELLRTHLERTMLVIAPGVLLGVPIAWTVSGRGLRGPARAVEVDHGLRFNGPVLLGAAAAGALALLAVCAPAILRSSGAARRRTVRRSFVAAQLATAGAPVAVVVGARHAFEAGQGRTSVPVRTATIVAVAAVAVATGAGVLATSLERLVARPSSYGITWNLELSTNVDPNRDCSDGSPCDATGLLAQRATDLEQFLRSEPAVTSWTPITSGVLAVGKSSIALFGLGAGAVRPTMIEGAPPRDGEVALGQAELRERHMHIGDTITTSDGAVLRVTGSAIAPVSTDPGSSGNVLGRGAVTTYATAVNVLAVTHTGFLVEVSDLHAVEAIVERFDAQHAATAEAFSADRPIDPITITDYRRVRAMPNTLAALLTVLGVMTLMLALSSSSRRRAPDFALLRALGTTRRQTTSTVLAQAFISTIVVAVAAVPIGLILGHATWSALERTLGTRSGWALPVDRIGAALVVVCVLVAAGAMASSRRLATARPADLLRHD
jgi:hypothetical protein